MRDRPRPTRTSTARFPDRTADRRAGELPDRNGEGFVNWIPIVVPLFAILLAVLVFFIFWAVLLPVGLA
jgi:hypothetical protein